MTVDELIEDFKLSKHDVVDYMRLKMKRTETERDIYSKMSLDELYSFADTKAKLRYEDVEYLKNLLNCNPMLKLREAEILRWHFRGLTLEESAIRTQIFLQMTIYKISS